MTLTPTAESFDIDWTDPRLNDDPISLFEEARNLGPVVYNAIQDEYMLVSYAANSQVLMDPAKFSSADSVERHSDLFGGLTMMATDDRDLHVRMRGIWGDTFGRKPLDSRRELVESVLATTLDPLIDRVRAGESVDAVSAATRHIPTLIIAAMMGLDPSCYDDVLLWTDAQIALISGGLDQSARGQQLIADGRDATHLMNELVRTELDRRRENPGDDLVDAMVRANAGLPESDMIAGLTQLIVAGNETTARGMAHAMVLLAGHPEERRRLVGNPQLTRRAVEEILRYECIVQWTSRITVTDCEIDGVHVPADSVVACLLGAANRDPNRWANPADFRVERPLKNNMGFGAGMHVCLGLNLARLEMQMFIDRLLGALPDWQVCEVDYGRSFPVRGPERVVISS